jgi:hypothetical protein
MGTALSKDLVRTAGTKLSLSKKEKQKKNFMGMDDPLASQKTSRATELETRLGKVEQAFLELNHTLGASSRAQTCHWDKLPTELKLRVFSYVGLVSKYSTARCDCFENAITKYALRSRSWEILCAIRL